MSPESSHEGQLEHPVSRIDGPLKVTGQATYAGEYRAPGMLHGAIVSSAIARGRIVAIDSAAARALPGVIEVFTHENRPKVSDRSKDYVDEVAPPGKPFRPLGSDRVLFSQQPIALVVAETFEAARDACALVKVSYAPEPHLTDLDRAQAEAYDPPQKRTGTAPPPKPAGRLRPSLRRRADEARGGVPHALRAPQRDGAVCHHLRARP